jgi:hypothetical protein
MNIPHTNYDLGFKEAITLFKDKTLDFFGVAELASIISEPLATESVQVEIKSLFRDLVFASHDEGRGFHFEEEVHLTLEDLWRFLDYNVSLYRIHKRIFDTVIFVKEPTDIVGIDEDRLTFKPIIVQCSDIDADDMLAELKRDIKDGKPINELKLIYLPLFRSTLNADDLFLESARLIHDMKVADSLKRKIIALSILIAGKVVDQDILNKVYREVKTMYSDNVILRVAENYGAERKVEEIARKMLAKGMDTLDVMDFTGLTTEQIREMRESMSKEAVLA